MSLLLLNQKTLFLHIPRTGGTWVSTALAAVPVTLNLVVARIPKSSDRGLVKKHCLLSHYAAPHRERYSWNRSFAFVRHPLAYYKSTWSYLNALVVKKRRKVLSRFIGFSWHPFQIPCREWDTDFSTWLEKMLDSHPGWVSHLFDLYVGPEGAEFCSYIGRTERLVEDFCSIMEEIGVMDMEKVRLIEKKNASKSNAVEVCPLLQERVERLEASAIRRFYGKYYTKIKYAA